MQVSVNPGLAYNPLFIYGGSGLGKTHLMHAIGNYVLHNTPNAKVLYVTSERFVKDYVDAVRLHSGDEFQNFYRSVDVLLVDDIQFIAGKSGSQEEFSIPLTRYLKMVNRLFYLVINIPKKFLN